MNKIETIFYTTIVGIIVVFGAGMYLTGAISNAPSHSTSSSTNSYNLTLVVTTQNYFQSADRNLPAFYVLQDGKLLSSSQLYLPANELIHVTIINYDSGPGTVPSQYSKVTGTANGTEFVMNNTGINMTSGSAGQWVSTVSSANLAHTFTIPGINLNILIPSQSIVDATFHTGNSGVYTWQCQVNCGTGTSGWGGPMTTPGWMMGQVVVQ